MNISETGKNLIKSFEGLRLQAYKVHEGEKYYTIGYGHYGADVSKNMVITERQANTLFDKDIQKYVNAVNNCKLAFTPNQNQFDALVSFCYNLGVNIMDDFIAMSSKQVANEMLLYVNSGGVRLEGLVKRREKEVELFNKPINEEEVIKIEYAETGTFYPNDTIYFRNYPKVSIDNPTKGTYVKGESVNYDKVVITNHYVYISWVSVSSGKRRYMPIREVINGNLSPIWGYIK